MVRADGIEVVVSDDLLVVAWSRSFRRLAAFVPVGRMVGRVVLVFVGDGVLLDGVR